MSRVRLARIAEPYWRAIPEPERERIEHKVPDGEYLAVTVPMTRGGRPTSFRARIYSEFTSNPLLLVEGKARRTLRAACWDALGMVA